MDATALAARITTGLPDVQTTEAYGYAFFFVGDGPNGVIEPAHDWTQRDVLPHKQYAPQSRVCVVSPSDATFAATVEPLLAEAHALAARRQPRARRAEA